MNALEEFHIELDQSEWDIKQAAYINQELQKVIEGGINGGSHDIQHFAEVDRRAFLFNVSPAGPISSKASMEKKIDSKDWGYFGISYLNKFEKKDFVYLYDRFQTTKNVYAKSQYGLVLFFSKTKQNNNFVIELLDVLIELLKTYIKKSKLNDDKDHYFLHAQTALANALYIGYNRKNVPEVSSRFKDLIKYTFEIHQSWDVRHRAILRVILDLTDFALQYFKDFQQTIALNEFIKKNREIANRLSETDIWGGIYITDRSIALSRKLRDDKEIKNWLRFKAELYEKLAIERKDDSVSVSFIERAMSIYKNLKDENNLARLQQAYQELRSNFDLNEISTQMPEGETQRIIQNIKKDVKDKREEDIIKTLLQTPMIRPVKEIKKWSEDSFKEPLLENILPTNIKDKFGNTVAQYITNEERRKLALLRTYEFHMQIALQVIIFLFMEAFHSNKITAKGIVRFIKQTWIGKGIISKGNGENNNSNYMSLVESGVNLFFDELIKTKDNPNYIPNFVSATDSLVLKAEFFLRQFCYFLGIATFKQRAKQQGIIMEKTLDDLLNDLDGQLSEDDLFFIKFILTEKVGYNLRNRVAHGLMDTVEYDLINPILAIIIILKLSNYQFISKKDK